MYLTIKTFNNCKILIIISLLISQFLIAQDYQLFSADRPLYKVKKASQKILVDGRMDEGIWKQANAQTFDYYYLANQPDDQQKTTLECCGMMKASICFTKVLINF